MDDNSEETVSNGRPPIKFGVTEEAIALLAEKNADLTTCNADNYPVVKANARELQKLRTGVDAKRKELNQDAIDWQRSVNERAAEVTKMITDIEDPLKKIKKDYEEKLQAEKEAEERRERERTDAINARIDAIEEAGRDLDGLTAEKLRERLEAVKKDLPTEEHFQEFTAVALERHESTVARLTVAHGRAVERELEAVRLQEEREQLAKEREEAEAKQRKEDERLAKEREEFEQQKREHEAKREEEDRERQREAEEQAAAAAAVAAEEQKKRDAEQAEQRRAEQEAREAEIAKQAAADAVAEREREEAEAKQREADRLAMAPDRERLLEYAGRLEALMQSPPTLDNDKAERALRRALNSLADTHNSLTATAERL